LSYPIHPITQYQLEFCCIENNHSLIPPQQDVALQIFGVALQTSIRLVGFARIPLEFAQPEHNCLLQFASMAEVAPRPAVRLPHWLHLHCLRPHSLRPHSLRPHSLRPHSLLQVHTPPPYPASSVSKTRSAQETATQKGLLQKQSPLSHPSRDHLCRTLRV
jgi:hypothetical protein